MCNSCRKWNHQVSYQSASAENDELNSRLSIELMVTRYLIRISGQGYIRLRNQARTTQTHFRTCLPLITCLLRQSASRKSFCAKIIPHKHAINNVSYLNTYTSLNNLQFKSERCCIMTLSMQTSVNFM